MHLEEVRAQVELKLDFEIDFKLSNLSCARNAFPSFDSKK